MARPAVADAVESEADNVAEKGSAEDLGGIRARIDDIDEGIGGDDEAEERGAQAHDGGPAKPAGKPVAECRCPDEWDGEHRDVGELVVRDGSIGEDLECLLRMDADVCQEEKNQHQDTGETDGVDRGAVARMQACEPRGDEVVPTGGHGETGDAGEDEAGGGDETELHEQDRGHGEEVGEAGVAECVAQGLGDGGDVVDVSPREGEDRAGAGDG